MNLGDGLLSSDCREAGICRRRPLWSAAEVVVMILSDEPPDIVVLKREVGLSESQRMCLPRNLSFPRLDKAAACRQVWFHLGSLLFPNEVSLESPSHTIKKCLNGIQIAGSLVVSSAWM